MHHIGFIGLGTMGAPMARNLLKAGFALRVFDIEPKAVQALVSAGATAATSAADAARWASTERVVEPDPAWTDPTRDRYARFLERGQT